MACEEMTSQEGAFMADEGRDGHGSVRLRPALGGGTLERRAGDVSEVLDPAVFRRAPSWQGETRLHGRRGILVEGGARTAFLCPRSSSLTPGVGKAYGTRAPYPLTPVLPLEMDVEPPMARRGRKGVFPATVICLQNAADGAANMHAVRVWPRRAIICMSWRALLNRLRRGWSKRTLTRLHVPHVRAVLGAQSSPKSPRKNSPDRLHGALTAQPPEYCGAPPGPLRG